MSGWRAAYTNDYGEYEITFESKDKAKTKAVEKVCCAIMDGLVKSPDDVIIGARPKGRWIDVSEPETPAWDRTYRCSKCGKIIVYYNPAFCSACGAKMEADE